MLVITTNVMLRRLAGTLAPVPRIGLLISESTAIQLPLPAAVSSIVWDQPMPGSNRSLLTLCSPQQQQHSKLQKHHGRFWQPAVQQQAYAAAGMPPLPLAAAAAAAGQLTALPQHPWQQLQQQRSLLGVVKHKNYQDHNQKKPPKYKIKTPSAVKRRVLVGEDGTMWRMQAGRRHKRYKKSRKRLLSLKGMVPLHSAHAAKLRKLGYKRNWWYTLKA